ncbi:MAG: ATP-binding protein [Eubacteriaceae bacterium]|jgi:thymidine kinase|nr:ATP-binding protein [Eubacteriaceae bacterium]
MIEFVVGAKGSGKTKKMIDMANDELITTKGDILFINDRDRYRVTVDTKIRFINTEEFGIKGEDQLYGFISGVLASNYDVSTVYLDNLLRILNADGPEQLEGTLERLDKLNKQQDVKFVLSVSCEEDNLPENLKKYM